MNVGLWAEIRRLAEIEKLSGWAISRRLRCSRHTVAQGSPDSLILLRSRSDTFAELLSGVQEGFRSVKAWCPKAIFRPSCLHRFLIDRFCDRI
jgi:hypothetical protein